MLLEEHNYSDDQHCSIPITSGVVVVEQRQVETMGWDADAHN
jgi:hypothetical protein